MPARPTVAASDPVPVRRLGISFHASFGRSLTAPPLRFPRVPATGFPEDLHLLVVRHAGRTREGPSPVSRGGAFTLKRLAGYQPKLPLCRELNISDLSRPLPTEEVCSGVKASAAASGLETSATAALTA